MSAAWHDILRAIEKHFIGGILYEPKLKAPRVKKPKPAKDKPKFIPIHYAVGSDFPGVYLTQREVDCVALLLQHLTNEEMARRLNLSPRTVEFYIKNMRQKLNCHSKIHLIDCIQKTSIMQLMEETLARLQTEARL